MKKLISKISETPENIKLITTKLIVHVLTIIGVVYYWETLNSFWLWTMISGIFIISAIGGEAYLHRYCTHNSFELSKPLKTIVHFFSMFNLQGGSTVWAVGHTQHHVYSDEDKDIFQPKKEFWKTWFWLNFHRTYNPEEFSTMLNIKNEDDDMKFFNNNYWKIYFSVIIISTLIDPRLTIFFFFVPVIITLHATGFTNVISHLNTFVGYRNFNTPDNSRNFYMPFLVGNTYHNNHHNDPNNYNTAVKWYEFDHIAWLINLLLLIDKLFKNCGIGTSHVINKDNQVCIKRWGIWTSHFTIFFSKILPIKEMYNIEQIYHSHQGSFVSFILKGVYLQDMLKEDEVIRTEHKWFNYLPCGSHHKIICYEPVYTLMIMGKRKLKPTVKLKQKGKKLRYDKFFKINDEEKI